MPFLQTFSARMRMTDSMKLSFPANELPRSRDEWLLTNDRGDYASGTVQGCHVRRYHGLLAAQAVQGKFMLLSCCEDSFAADGMEYPLSVRIHPDVFWPEGWKWENDFSCVHGEISRVFHLPLPTGETALLRRSVRLCRSACRIIVRYELSGARPASASITLKPLAACRPADHLLRAGTSRAGSLRPAADGPAGCSLGPAGDVPPLFMHISGSGSPSFTPAPDWYYNVLYPTEKERGYDWEEDLFMPGSFRAEILPGRPVYFTAGTEPASEDPERMWESAGQDGGSPSGTSVHDHLLRECRRFLIRIGGSPVVPAGYHWFGPWGRDTLIALPGLTFYEGSRETGREILKNIASSVRGGLVPNLLGSGYGTPSYNSADASLWFLLAVQRLAEFPGEEDFVAEECWPAFLDILKNFAQGTMPDGRGGMLVHADEEGLLHAGNSRTQLTWMDASVDGAPVTPRHGCAVELNALWFNGLSFAARFAAEHAMPAPPETALLPAFKKAFRKAFIPPAADRRADGGLYDTWSPFEGAAPRIRPNQVIAAAMPFSPLAVEERRSILACVKKHLLTPFGLRTLSPSDPEYRPCCRGSQRERDAAYHQGTVWPWLLGFYAEALLLAGASPARLEAFLDTISPLYARHLLEAGIGCVSEIFDGDPPHAPGGCIAQAWSTAELFRILILFKKAHPGLTEKWLNSHPLIFTGTSKEEKTCVF